MARQEHDREDLLREATALVPRVEIHIPAYEEPIVIGFRSEGGASFFFGAELVYHFNSRRQFRRGYHQDRLIKAEKGRIVALTRRRAAGQVQLVRHEMDETETRQFLTELVERLGQLRSALQSNQYRIAGQAPPGSAAIPRAEQWLEAAQKDPLEIAPSPHAK